MLASAHQVHGVIANMNCATSGISRNDVLTLMLRINFELGTKFEVEQEVIS